MDSNQAARRQPGQPPPGGAPRPRNPFHPSFHAQRRAAHNNPSTTSVHIAAEESDPKDDMVERDSEGEHKVVAPSFTPLDTASMLGGDSDDEEEERRMIMCYWDNKDGKDPMPPAMYAAIKQSLMSSMVRAAKSLENDRWMFEGDKKRRF